MRKYSMAAIVFIGIAAFFCFSPSEAFAQNSTVDSLIADMTLREKVGQLFILEYADGIEKEVRRDKIGGIILMESPLEKYGGWLNALQKESSIPLVISIDGEWGASMRFDTLTQFPRNMQMGALSSPELVYKAGIAMASQFRRLGINIDFAPSVDINSNPLNPAIGPRSFGDDREKVAAWGAALMHGLQDGGILTSAKHFPGHGDTETDSHKALPLLPFDRERLDSLELYPFMRLINEGVAMVMVGHLNVPALDSTGMPSSISYQIITKLLKEQMGFKGIVITDALAMKGVSTYVRSQTVPLESFKAGSDILLMPPHKWHRSIKTLYKAVRRGEIPVSRVDESLRKILLMKQQLGILKNAPEIVSENIFQDVETPETLSLIQEICDSSVTMVTRPSGNYSSVDTVSLSRDLDYNSLRQAKESAEELEHIYLKLPAFRAPKNNKELYTSVPPQEIYNFVSQWATEQKITLLIMDTPYVLNKIDVDAFDGIYICYSDTPANRLSAWKVISGQMEAKGVLPVSAGGFPTGYSALTK